METAGSEIKKCISVYEWLEIEVKVLVGWNRTLESEPFQEQSAGITAKSLLLMGEFRVCIKWRSG